MRHGWAQLPRDERHSGATVGRVKSGSRTVTLTRAHIGASSSTGSSWYNPQMVDSGAHWYCDGMMYFRQLDQLTINISTAKTIDDKDWLAFLEDTLALSRRLGVPATVSLICCVNTYPSARQRMTASDFLERHRLERIGRVAVVTDNALVRGAVTAFSWLKPKLQLSEFRSAEAVSAFQWLRQGGTFDEAQAVAAWNEARMQLGMTPGMSIRPTPVR